MEKFRIERDSLGEVEVPQEAYYGAQTARSLIFFNISRHDDRVPLRIIHAYGLLKRMAAEVNHELGLLSSEKKELIVKAAKEVEEGKLDTHFPLSIWQTGSGTQTNMNVNEVIANRAIEIAGGIKGSKTPIHPNDDVNLSQSSNDSFPTVMHITSADILLHMLLPELRATKEAFQRKSEEFASIVKIGRTHMMDALPLTLGQEFSGYVEQLLQNIERIEHGLPRLYELGLGGTAVGTGFLSPKEFAPKVISKIAAATKIPFIPAHNKFASLSSHDPLVSMSGHLKTLSGSLIKIATDLTMMGSGPRCGLNELHFPANEPGSSIMPGKVNPTQCEMLTMVATQVIGIDASISIAGSRGNFELNVYKPLIIRNFIRSCALLSDALKSFRTYFVDGLVPNRGQIASNLDRSLMLVTALQEKIGYDKAAKVAHKAYHEDLTLKEAVLDLGYITELEFDKIMRPEEMT
jgi:fumarate hydratase class II